MLGTSPRWHAAGLRVIEAADQTPENLRGSTLLLGNFDGFHRGHQTLLTAGRGASGTFRTPLGVMSCEPHPKTYFSRGAAAFRLTTPSSKEQEIARYGFDFHYRPVFDKPFASMEAETFVRQVLLSGLGASHVICGGDFRFGQGRIGDARMLLEMGQDLGMTVTIMARAEFEGARISSSRIRDALRDGKLGMAKSMLGRFWSFVGDLADDGALRVPDELAPLAEGHYHATVRRGGSVDEAMATLIVTQDGLSLQGADGPMPGVEVTPLIQIA